MLCRSILKKKTCKIQNGNPPTPWSFNALVLDNPQSLLHSIPRAPRWARKDFENQFGLFQHFLLILLLIFHVNHPPRSPHPQSTMPLNYGPRQFYCLMAREVRSTAAYNFRPSKRDSLAMQLPPWENVMICPNRTVLNIFAKTTRVHSDQTMETFVTGLFSLGSLRTKTKTNVSSAPERTIVISSGVGFI